MKLSQILDAVPDYQHFLSVEELQKSSKELSEKFQNCDWYPLGKSREGRTIYCLKIGKGSKNALFVAYPHPNEPMGAMTIEFISRFLVENPDFLKKSDFTWYFIKAIDIDGVILNEGWYKQGYTPVVTAKNYYRPPLQEQVEWSFPIEYKKLKFSKPLPETIVLMKLINEIKPDFYYSLHNAEFCGAYYYLSHPVPEVYNPLTELVEQEGIPIHLGEPEISILEPVVPGIFKIPYIRDVYDAYAKKGFNLAKFWKAGGGSADYIKEFANENVFGLACELPYISHEKVMDFSYTNERKRMVYKEKRKFCKKIDKKLISIFKEIEPYADKSSRLYTAIEESTKVRSILSIVDHLITSFGIKIGQKATVAEKFEAEVTAPFSTLKHNSMIGRLCEEVATLHPEKKERFLELQREWETMVESEFNRILDGVEYRVIPIRTIVRIQAGSAFIVMNYQLKGNLLE